MGGCPLSRNRGQLPRSRAQGAAACAPPRILSWDCRLLGLVPEGREGPLETQSLGGGSSQPSLQSIAVRFQGSFFQRGFRLSFAVVWGGRRPTAACPAFLWEPGSAPCSLCPKLRSGVSCGCCIFPEDSSPFFYPPLVSAPGFKSKCETSIRSGPLSHTGLSCGFA